MTGFSFFHCVASPFHSFVTTSIVCYTEKASPTRHRPEHQHNARSIVCGGLHTHEWGACETERGIPEAVAGIEHIRSTDVSESTRDARRTRQSRGTRVALVNSDANMRISVPGPWPLVLVFTRRDRVKPQRWRTHDHTLIFTNSPHRGC